MKAWETFKEYFMITVGVAIVAVSVYFLLVPSHVTVGSISGLSIILEYFIPLPLSVITFILNAILLVVGFLLIGKDFGIKTVYTSLMMPVMMGVLERIYPDVQSIMKDPFLDMIVYIFIVSIGQAVMFRYNASSGGLDIVGKVLNKYMHIELGRAISMAGMLVAISSILTSDLNMVILSILGTYLSGIILDHFIFDHNIKRRVCIITKKEEELRRFIIEDLHSGATIYEAIGAYNFEKHNEIITIVNKSEYQKLMNFINREDPKAFITVYNVSDMRYQPKVWEKEAKER